MPDSWFTPSAEWLEHDEKRRANPIGYYRVKEDRTVKEVDYMIVGTISYWKKRKLLKVLNRKEQKKMLDGDVFACNREEMLKVLNLSEFWYGILSWDKLLIYGFVGIALFINLFVLLH